MLLALASFAAVIGMAAPAQADPGSDRSGADASFLAALDKAGITYHNGADAIAAGKNVCQLLDQGQRRSDVIKTVSESNPGFTMSSALSFTTVAEKTYCPQHLSDPPPTEQAPPPSWWIPPEFPLPPPPAAR